jgi:hypothetical protein
MKPDNFLRFLLVLVVLLLAAIFCVQYFFPVGRYVQLPSESQLVVLDTRTGTVYLANKETKSVVEINMIELARKQKEGKP